MKPPEPTEYEHQKHIFLWADVMSMKHPELRFLSGSLNGVRLTIGQAKKAMAVTRLLRGFPDLFLPVPRGGYHGLFIELKRKKGGVVSKDQKTWLYFLNDQGYRAVVCRGKSEAIREIIEYLEKSGG